MQHDMLSGFVVNKVHEVVILFVRNVKLLGHGSEHDICKTVIVRAEFQKT